jgi:hypothetical protein
VWRWRIHGDRAPWLQLIVDLIARNWISERPQGDVYN